MSANSGTIALALRLSKRMRMPTLAAEILADVSQDLAPKRYAETAGEYETRFGTVTIGPDWCGITAHGGQLWQWANRTGSVWPCSELADLDGITVGFDSGGLVECEEDPAPIIDDDGISSSSLMGDELSAWSADALRAAGLSPSHPCHFVCIGQFQG